MKRQITKKLERRFMSDTQRERGRKVPTDAYIHVRDTHPQTRTYPVCEYREHDCVKLG